MAVDRSGAAPVHESRSNPWVSVVLIPVAFLLAMAAGYVAYDLLGYKAENDDAPLWADLVAAVPSLAILWVPCAAAVVYGRRASGAGDRGALIPAVIGAAVGIGFTALTLVTALASPS